MVGGEQEQLLVQESAVPVAGGSDPSHPAIRLAHFLHPRASPARRPALPSPPRNAGPILADELQVEFKGWAEPPVLWRRWVDKLRPRYEALWRRIGILDAVLATTCRVRRDDGAMLQLAAIWSADTNTFLFPWGEATVTLEDVAVLAGLPLLGPSVRGQPDGARAPRGDVEALQAVRRLLYKKKGQRPDHLAWATRFLEQGAAAHDGEADGLLEHGAFLAMWLSLFVLPAPPADLIRSEVLPIAARLARGGCVALAPAVLAAIYSDLSAMNRRINLDKTDKPFPFPAWAPLHILQLWVLARFPELRPEMATTTTLDPLARRQPWAARWHEVHREIDPLYLHAVFMSPKDFEWRPYGASSFAHAPEKACSWVRGREIAGSKQLLSFALCLRACELVGMLSIEQYNPHRVARQLGFDQDVPGPVARVNSDWEIAWGTYTMEPRNFAFIVPQYTLAVTVEYAQWWEPYSVACATAVANSAKLKEFRALVSSRGEVLHDDNASKEEVPELVMKQNSSSEHGEVAHHHPVKGALSTTSSKATGSATVAHLKSSFEDMVVVTSDDESDELVGKEHGVGAMPIEGKEKANKGLSASEQQSGSLLEDCAVVNRKSSGNNKMSSSDQVDANPEQPKRAISTNTLYYLKPFGRVKDTQGGDAVGANVDQGEYLPRREVGTKEMIEEASAAREAEKIVLQKAIGSLKEEIAAARAQLRDRNPSKA